jgi:hypothetical protein
MATKLKCPNPSCPYLFDPSTVPAGVVLACPRCTMRFVLGPGAVGAHPQQAASAVSRDQRAHVAHGAHPGAPSQAAQRPGESPFAEMTPETARPDGAMGPRLPVRSSRLQTILLVGVAAIGLAAAAIAVWYKLTNKPEVIVQDPVTKFPEKNFSFIEPAGPWTQDGEMQGALGSPFLRVYKRDNPEAFIALGARDFVDRTPQPGELQQPLLLALRRLLTAGTLKMQTIPEGAEWFGRGVGGFTFRGQLKNGSIVEGEAYHVDHQGIGYWFLAWTGENQIYAEQKEVFAKVRSQFKLLDLRNDWTARRAPTIRFTNNVLGYAILDGERIWTEVTDEKAVKAEDPAADKYFTARIKRKGSDFSHEAELVILVLDAKGDEPFDQARKYLEERENRDVENRGKTTFELHNEDTSFDEPNAVEGNAPFMLLKSRNSVSEQSALWALSAIRIGDKIVAARAKCSFTQEDREQFERKFVVLVRSLRAAE